MNDFHLSFLQDFHILLKSLCSNILLQRILPLIEWINSKNFFCKTLTTWFVRAFFLLNVTQFALLLIKTREEKEFVH